MNILVIGDIHGCVHTLKSLVKNYWNHETSVLIILGDLIHKGLHSGKTIRYIRKISKKFPDSVIVLKGNHEQMVYNAFLKGEKYSNWKNLKKDIRLHSLNVKKILKWICDLPTIWENDNIVITHAGIAVNQNNDIDLDAPNSILNNRSAIKNIGKLQIFGHVIQEYNQPRFFPESNSWGIDTGCWIGGGLTAILMEPDGKIIEIIRQPTIQSDL
tara:strand:- start:48 stop:689 length:642 start_codon:yes stop_codon:yes gene_type:complete